MLSRIRHENVIRFYDFFIDRHFLYVVMERCSGGELFQKVIQMKRFCEEDAAHLCRQIMNAVAYIHKISICHRDIKGENFLLDGDPDIRSCTVKMIDFGLATIIYPGERLRDICGSPHYLAPELLGQDYRFEVDLWSTGVLMYLLLYGHYPYDGSSQNDIMTKILRSPIQWTHHKYTPSPECLDFLKRLLCRKASHRMTAVDALEHPWLAEPADESVSDSVPVPGEILRSAHRRATATRKKVEPEIEQRRNSFLKQIEDDYNKGIKHGQRLYPAAVEEVSGRPEFLRRDNKLVTAPSWTLKLKHGSMENQGDEMIGAVPCEAEEDRQMRRRTSEVDLGEDHKAKLRAMFEDFKRERSSLLSGTQDDE
ncbi:Serine/threonine-protein kinase 17A [Perkinsus chesapeaki]|uniref:Serine/threonine-protein kinase 17A n=1 Tax=Perkinsus chesapeaki TaxID=330153 RepID=A0A7J6L1S0_PERCH|nr:Serine/threonine-protein kinase 17A [Perkinsus chesapeaki]